MPRGGFLRHVVGRVTPRGECLFSARLFLGPPLRQSVLDSALHVCGARIGLDRGGYAPGSRHPGPHCWKWLSRQLECRRLVLFLQLQQQVVGYNGLETARVNYIGLRVAMTLP